MPTRLLHRLSRSCRSHRGVHRRNIRFTPLAAMSAMAVAAVVATPEVVQAQVTIAPGGNVPFGSSSQWSAIGFGQNTTGSSFINWNLRGTTTDSSVQSEPNRTGTGSQFVLQNVVEADTGAMKLSSAATISADIPLPGRFYARGWSTATINDLLFVNTFGPTLTSGFLSFSWTINGNLLWDLHSDGSALSVRGGLQAGGLARAETFVNWSDPGSSGGVRNSTVSSPSVDSVRSLATLTDEQYDARDLLDITDTVLASFYAPGSKDYSQNTNYSNTDVFTGGVNVGIGTGVQVQLGLITLYNALWDLDDFGLLTSKAKSEFDHTATLTGVKLCYDAACANPYVGAWELVSQNKYQYNEIIITDTGGGAGGNVPEPGSMALLVAGLSGLVAAGRGRAPRRARAAR